MGAVIEVKRRSIDGGNRAMKCIGIVNRGEPAIRFLNALDALKREEEGAPIGVALYTEADAQSVYVRAADKAVLIGAGRRRATSEGLRVAMATAA